MTILGSEGQILTAARGARGVDDVDEDSPLARRGSKDYPVDALQGAFFFSISETIWGGTAEIQRNIVGERVLGLPKEPKPQN
jgi:alkylation response protein AidB-like acyl-CoA dehydrogenase